MALTGMSNDDKMSSFSWVFLLIIFIDFQSLPN